MCVPLGHRSGGSHGGSIKTKISQSEVERIIELHIYDLCLWKKIGSDAYIDCIKRSISTQFKR